MKIINTVIKVAALGATLPMLVFTELNRTNMVPKQSIHETVLNRTITTAEARSGDVEDTGFPGMLNSRIIVINY